MFSDSPKTKWPKTLQIAEGSGDSPKREKIARKWPKIRVLQSILQKSELGLGGGKFLLSLCFAQVPVE